MKDFMEIHQRALKAAGNFKRAEADLILSIQEVDESKAYESFECASLYSYCMKVLGLSEWVSLNFIAVARKACHVPALQSAIRDGLLSVSMARKITPVITAENQTAWVEKAMTLSCRKLEEEVARVAPREATPERMKPVSEDRFELRLGLSRQAQEKLRRVQDLESQRTRRAVSFEETLETLIDLYLEAKDPVKKAERILKKKSADKTASEPVLVSASDTDSATDLHVTGHVGRKSSGGIPAAIKHQVFLRDKGQCTKRDPQGKRCENRRWIDVHHICPRYFGGTNELDNLVTLCSAHHTKEHEFADSISPEEREIR